MKRVYYAYSLGVYGFFFLLAGGLFLGLSIGNHLELYAYIISGVFLGIGVILGIFCAIITGRAVLCKKKGTVVKGKVLDIRTINLGKMGSLGNFITVEFPLDGDTGKSKIALDSETIRKMSLDLEIYLYVYKNYAFYEDAPGSIKK